MVRGAVSPSSARRQPPSAEDGFPGSLGQVSQSVGDRKDKLASGTRSEHGRYVKSIGEPRDGNTACMSYTLGGTVCMSILQAEQVKRRFSRIANFRKTLGRPHRGELYQ